jgi:PEGA domain
VTEPERPGAAPVARPTQEEISARLEALLKRTHALRAQQPPVSSGGPLSMTWPPPDRELDRYDVVDVPEERRRNTAELPVSPPPTPTLPPTSLPVVSGDELAPAAQRAQSPVAESSVPVDTQAAPEVPTPDFTRPDWSELRLRTTPDDAPRRSVWRWLLTLALVLATVGQAGYIWYLRTAVPATERGRIRVDGPAGADVRVDGRSIGVAPVEHILDAGDYEVELRHQGRVVRADRVAVGVGRTVLLLAPTTPQTATAGGGSSAASTPGSAAPSQAVARVPSGAGSSPAASADLVSATTGAVTIESTPPGLPVTMGGRPRGVTPLTLGKIPPGRHDVLVGTAARQVDVTAGAVATLRVLR